MGMSQGGYSNPQAAAYAAQFANKGFGGYGPLDGMRSSSLGPFALRAPGTEGRRLGRGSADDQSNSWKLFVGQVPLEVMAATFPRMLRNQMCQAVEGMGDDAVI